MGFLYKMVQEIREEGRGEAIDRLSEIFIDDSASLQKLSDDF